MTSVLHLLASADRRGAEVFGHDLARRLGDHGLPGEVLALSPARPGAAALDVEVLAAGPYRGLGELRRRAAAADVVVGHGSTGLTGGALATLGRATPFVYRSIGDPSAWGAARLDRRVRVRVQLRRAATVVSLWDGAAEVVGSAFAIPPDRRAVIPNGADPRTFTPAGPIERATARAGLGLGDGPVLAVVGALGPEKRVHLAVAALDLLPDAALLVVGDGPCLSEVRAAAARHGGRVRFLGSHDDVTPIYRAADVVVSTSRTEGQSGVLIEARLAAVGIVATDVGGTSSVVEPGTGALVPADPSSEDLAAAVRTVLAVPEAERRAGSERAAAQFGLDQVTARWADLLRRVTAGSGR